MVDLRISKKFKIYKTHNIEVSGDVFNLANFIKKKLGVNESLGAQALYALNGVAAIAAVPPSTVGTPAVPNYDAATRSFNYRVNNSGIVNPSRNPYQFQLGLRYGF